MTAPRPRLFPCSCWLLLGVLAGACAPPVVVVTDVGTGDDAPADAGIAALPDAPPVEPVDAGTDAAEPPPDAPVPTFGEIYETILQPRCSSCHDRDPAYTFSTRDEATAYATLVSQEVTTKWIPLCLERRGDSFTAYRVRPGDLETSLLAWLSECYVRDADHGSLTDTEAGTIRRWIAGGAPEDAF